MIKDIKFAGLSAQPSDYESKDGDLAVSINLVPEDGALKPVQSPANVMKLGEGETVKFIHKTSSFEHYIIYSSSTRKIASIDKKTTERIELGTLSSVSHFNAVGNTLLAFTAQGFYYFLWKDGKYANLGNHIPDVEVSFGLVGHPRLFSLSDESKSTFTINFDKISESTIYNELSENNKTRITDQIMAKVNKFVAQETVNKGRFCFPFFVRYALRLFDGSLVYHSAPILMNPSTKAAPIVWWKRVKGKGGYTEAICDIMLVAATLDYRVIRNTDSYSLDDWSDIIKSIDVFISKPIYTYDQNGKISSLADPDNYDTKFIGRLYADNKDSVSSTLAEDKVLGNFASKEFLNHYCEWTYANIYGMYYSADRSYPATTFNLPEFTDGKVRETLQNTSTFYKLRSIEITEALADNKRKDIVVDDEYLQSLVTREVMTDDYLTRDQLHVDYSFAYNSRLNLSGLKRKPFKGFLAQSMFAYCDSAHSWVIKNGILNVGTSSYSGASYSVTVYIKENGNDYAVSSETYYMDSCYLIPYNDIKKIKVDSDGNELKDENGQTVSFDEPHSWGCYVFYPNSNAYKMVIYNYGSPCYAIDLKAHEFLNGAYAILDYEQSRTKNFTSLPSVYPSDEYNSFPIAIPNKIYTSEVNNPFYFPVLGINTVGTGEIKGICSAAKALSQGQFGQFPLYAFTTEGVWALEVSNTGSYTARQPITRDVCINSEGITQIDSSVLFPTDRGIMLISGSQTQCITDTIKTEFPFDLLSLPHMKELHDRLNHNAEYDKCLPMLPFTEFLKTCRMIYDYVHQRIIVYNSAVTYAYVYSLKSQLWGMTYSNIADNVNSYPNALAIDTTGYLVDFSLAGDGDDDDGDDDDGDDDGDDVHSMLVTRPLKLETPDILKTMDTVIQRGHFQKGHVQSVLYGSRDLYNWHLVWSSKDHYMRGFRGSPYKYFRIALLCNLSPDESVFGASLQFTPRLTDQPR